MELQVCERTETFYKALEVRQTSPTPCRVTLQRLSAGLLVTVYPGMALIRYQTMGLIYTLEHCLNRTQTVGLIHTLQECINRMQNVELIHTLQECLNRMQTGLHSCGGSDEFSRFTVKQE